MGGFDFNESREHSDVIVSFEPTASRPPTPSIPSREIEVLRNWREHMLDIEADGDLDAKHRKGRFNKGTFLPKSVAKISRKAGKTGKKAWKGAKRLYKGTK